MSDDRLDRLRTMLRERAVRFGDFLLSSGKRSDVYCDARAVTLSGDGAALVAELLWERIAPLRPDALGGLVIGADPIVGAVLAHAARAGAAVSGFLVRKEPKAHGTRRRVEGPRPPPPSPRVVVLEDTVTTGRSLLDAARCVREEWGARVVGAFAIVDREEGGGDALRAEGIELAALVRLSELRA
jgi:orotate phosphoribosyltransferase